MAQIKEIKKFIKATDERVFLAVWDELDGGYGLRYSPSQLNFEEWVEKQRGGIKIYRTLDALAADCGAICDGKTFTLHIHNGEVG